MVNKGKITCETVKVDITDMDGQTVSLTIPAYTRTVGDFIDTQLQYMNDYVGAAEATGTEPSTGDFICWLLNKASTEPREQ